MQIPGLSAFCVVSLYSLVRVQGLIFDILRNTSKATPSDLCARMHCYVKRDNQTTLDIQHIISLTISMVDGDQKTVTRLAGLSFFEAGVHIYGSPSKVSATGQLVPKNGELNVYLKDFGESCQSGVFTCELRFINSQNKGEVVNAEKKLVIVKDITKGGASEHLDLVVVKYLKTIMADEVSKIGQQSENLTNTIVSTVQSMSQRLLRLESIVIGNLQTRFDDLDKKMNKLEMMLRENVEPKLASLTKIVENSTDSLKTYITDSFDVTQEQLNRLESSIEDRFSSTENWLSESFKQSSVSKFPCQEFQANMSTIFHQIQDQVSSFKTEVMGKLSAAETRLESTTAHRSTRLIVETLVRMGHNISETESKLNRLKTDLNAEINTVRLNISSLNENMLDRHDRFIRQVKEDIQNLDNKLSSKFVEFDQEKQTLTSLDSDMKGKLLNIEINLKDINVVMKNIKYFFGL